jgi:hypothetical protein
MKISYRVGDGWRINGTENPAPFLRYKGNPLNRKQRMLVRALRASYKGCDIDIEKVPGQWWGVRVYSPWPFEDHVQTSRRTLRAAVSELMVLRHRRRPTRREEAPGGGQA